MALTLPSKVGLKANQSVNPLRYKEPGIANGSRQNVSMDISFAESDKSTAGPISGHVKRKALGVWLPAGENVNVTVTPISNPTQTGSLPLILSVNGGHENVAQLINETSFFEAPLVTASQTMNEGVNTISSEFGGLLYLDHKSVNAEEYQISISGGIIAPTFRVGETDFAQWKSSINTQPTPKFDIISDHLIVTTDVKQTLQQSDDKLKETFSNTAEGMEAMLTLIGLTEDDGIHKRPAGVQHVVEAAQLPGGMWKFGYAGHPIRIKKYWMSPYRDMSVIFHEIAHNYDNPVWTPNHGGNESVANLMTMYVVENSNVKNTNIELPYASTISRLSSENYGGWKTLDLYKHQNIFWMQLKLLFGWDMYTELFKKHREDRVKGLKFYKNKADNLLLNASAITNVDLAPHFDAYKINVGGHVKRRTRCRMTLVSPISWQVTPETTEMVVLEDNDC